MPKVFITGVGGLVGSEVARYFSSHGWKVWGVENNTRAALFGEGGNVLPTLNALKLPDFQCYMADIRDLAAVKTYLEGFRPDAVIHTAGQPSHDYSMTHPFLDLDLNAKGTLTILEATRMVCGNVPFVHLSTNKVYGNFPGTLSYVEEDTRYTPKGRWIHGFDESLPLDGTIHSLFGVSKVYADLAVQEYDHYYGMQSACFRCGCITGHAHQGVELHGFLSYLCRCIRHGIPYTVYGYKGKQVRDNIHAWDVAAAAYEFVSNPHPGVYNMGGGKENSISVVEAIKAFEKRTGYQTEVTFLPAPRRGDHIWWVSDTGKFEKQYPHWKREYPLDEIIRDMTP